MKKSTLRQQAEEKLSKQKSAATPETEADTLRLLHELQVHQIELEMQNEELVQARAETEAALRQYTDLYDFAPVGYFTLARDGAISKVNLAGANLLGAGAERGKLIKRRLGVFIPAQSRTTFNAFLDKVFTSGENETCEIELLKDGSTPLWTHIEAITDSDEREACRLVVVDITERKQAEEKIRTMNAELEQRVEERTRELREAQKQLILKEKLSVLGQLAGGMGHELRNPLAVINNAIYYLNLVQPNADDKVREYHAMIKKEVQNTERIINDLLDFERAGSADPEPVSVTELIQRVLERHPAPSSVKVTHELPADLPKIYADSRQMEQTLGYLVINAYQSMTDGGELVISSQCSVISEQNPLNTDTSTALNTSQRVLITVKDSGTGITPENMQRIFEPLFTTKSKGLGLGLAISKKFVEANDGWFEVESKAGKGSTFTVYLPAYLRKAG